MNNHNVSQNNFYVKVEEEIFKTCRLCAEIASPAIDLLASSHQKLAAWLESHLQIVINEKNGYPNYVCISCLDFIEKWIIFKKRCKEAERHFQSLKKSFPREFSQAYRLQSSLLENIQSGGENSFEQKGDTVKIQTKPANLKSKEKRNQINEVPLQTRPDALHDCKKTSQSEKSIKKVQLEGPSINEEFLTSLNEIYTQENASLLISDTQLNGSHFLENLAVKDNSKNIEKLKTLSVTHLSTSFGIKCEQETNELVNKQAHRKQSSNFFENLPCTNTKRKYKIQGYDEKRIIKLPRIGSPGRNTRRSRLKNLCQHTFETNVSTSSSPPQSSKVSRGPPVLSPPLTNFLRPLSYSSDPPILTAENITISTSKTPAKLNCSRTYVSPTEIIILPCHKQESGISLQKDGSKSVNTYKKPFDTSQLSVLNENKKSRTDSSYETTITCRNNIVNEEFNSETIVGKQGANLVINVENPPQVLDPYLKPIVFTKDAYISHPSQASHSLPPLNKNFVAPFPISVSTSMDPLQTQSKQRKIASWANSSSNVLVPPLYPALNHFENQTQDLFPFKMIPPGPSYGPTLCNSLPIESQPLDLCCKVVNTGVVSDNPKFGQFSPIIVTTPTLSEYSTQSSMSVEKPCDQRPQGAKPDSETPANTIVAPVEEVTYTSESLKVIPWEMNKNACSLKKQRAYERKLIVNTEGSKKNTNLNNDTIDSHQLKNVFQISDYGEGSNCKSAAGTGEEDMEPQSPMFEPLTPVHLHVPYTPRTRETSLFLSFRQPTASKLTPNKATGECTLQAKIPEQSFISSLPKIKDCTLPPSVNRMLFREASTLAENVPSRKIFTINEATGSKYFRKVDKLVVGTNSTAASVLAERELHPITGNVCSTKDENSQLHCSYLLKQQNNGKILKSSENINNVKINVSSTPKECIPKNQSIVQKFSEDTETAIPLSHSTPKSCAFKLSSTNINSATNLYPNFLTPIRSQILENENSTVSQEIITDCDLETLVTFIDVDNNEDNFIDEVREIKEVMIYEFSESENSLEVDGISNGGQVDTKNEKMCNFKKGIILECPYCKFTCVQRYYFDVHITKHEWHSFQKKSQCLTKTSPFPCMYCESNFISQKKRDLHSDSSHQESHPFLCKKCHMRFQSQVKYKHHVNVHNPEYYLCPYCSKEYKEKENMKNHVKRNHRLNSQIDGIIN